MPALKRHGSLANSRLLAAARSAPRSLVKMRSRRADGSRAGRGSTPGGPWASASGVDSGVDVGTAEADSHKGVDAEPADDSLVRLVGPVHRDAARLAAWAGGAAPGADPRQIHRAGDTAVAAMCAHLATMGYVIYPEVARLLPHTESRITRLRAGAREMLIIMRGVQQYAQGDTHPPGAEATELRRELATAISDHSREEEDLLREFDQASTPEQRQLLAAEYERALPRAPSRPHPHLLRSRGLLGGRLGYRMMARFDYLLDTMDARVIPWAKVREPGKVGPWGTWLLGRPPQARPPAPQATTTGWAPGPDASQPETSAVRPRG